MKKNFVKTFLVMTMITVMFSGCGKKNVNTEINVPESSVPVVEIAQGSEIEESSEVIESEEIFESSETEEIEETSEVEETSSVSDNEEETEETIESTESTPAPQETAKPVTSTKPQETTKPEVKPSEAPVAQETAKPTEKPQESEKPQQSETPKPTAKPQESAKPQETVKPTPTPEVHTHKYTEKVTTKATCKAEGVKTFTCNCGDTYTETIAKSTTHTFNNGATCTVCGTSNPNYVTPTPTPANPDTPWNCEINGHKFVAIDEFIEKCSVCSANRAIGCGNGAHLGLHFCADRSYSDATHYTEVFHNWCSSCGWEECYYTVNTLDPETGVSWESSRTYGSFSHACNK